MSDAMAIPAEIASGAAASSDAMRAPGFDGFADLPLMGQLAASLLLAVVLAATIGFHPQRPVRARTLEDAEAPRVNVIYATVGAIIGTLVVHYGTLVGFVVFGIGGLMRFRTNTASAAITGRLLISTLIGLCCGLQLPHIAVVATVFSFALLALLERRPACRLVVKGLAAEELAAAAGAWRRELDAAGCRVISEEKNFLKPQVAFVFYVAGGEDPDELAARVEARIDGAMRGATDWEVG